MTPTALPSSTRTPFPISCEEAQRRWGAELERRILESATATGLVREMLDYQLASGGKRLRSLLPVWVAATFGGRPEDALDIGVGLELLHNATLVHDDLQDGDLYRRGAPTVWRRWGAAQAINAGDALVFEALARIGRAPAGARVMPVVCSLMLRVIEGQAMDLQIKLPEGDPAALRPTVDAWGEVAVRKTGAFFTACLQAGAIAAGAGERAIEEGAAYGALLGLLFQAQDDYLEYVGEKGRRQRGGDLMEGKLSFPVVWVYETAAPPEGAALRRIVECPREQKTPEIIEEARDLLERTGALAATARRVRDLFEQALAHPFSERVPELAARLVAPVAHALPPPASGRRTPPRTRLDVAPARNGAPSTSWSSELHAVLAQPMLGVVDPTAYDTAWAARVPRRDDDGAPAFPSALEWLLAHQHADGSFGAALEYHHDRIQSTLRAALTLAHWQRRGGHGRWQQRIDAALGAVGRHGALLSRDPYETIGFELILPTLLDEARALGLALPFDAFEPVRRMGEDKLARIPPGLFYTPRTTLPFSAEFLGAKLDAAKMSAVLDAQGLLGCSPAATACYLVQAPGDRAAHAYLAGVLARSGGAAPAVGYIDVFEPAWVLHDAALVWPEPRDLPPAALAAIEHLGRQLATKGGASYSEHFPVPDLDETAMVARVLGWAGVPWEIELLKAFEEADHFRCYAHERNTSVSTHVHLVEALVHAPPSGERTRMLAKARGFLDRARVSGTFWFDKWHASPYYPTGHAILALEDDHALVDGAVQWIVETQRPDGLWGHYASGTAEETAYCVQALALHRRRGGRAFAGVLARGAAFLERSPERLARRYTPLWIGKTLYTPPVVVHATVLAALALAEAP